MPPDKNNTGKRSSINKEFLSDGASLQRSGIANMTTTEDLNDGAKRPSHEAQHSEATNSAVAKVRSPIDVLNASLDFEKSHNLDENENVAMGEKYLNQPHQQNAKYETILPLTSLKSSRSSSSRSSLYPSLEFVSRTASDFDNDQVEESWKKAAAVSKKKKQQATLLSTPSLGSVGTDSRKMSRREYPLSYSGFNGFDGAALSPSTGSMGVNAALSERRDISGLGSPSMPVAAPGALFRNIHDNTATTSALGSPTDPAPSSASAPNLGSYRIPSEPTHNREDEDMIALKMAAYGGGPITCTVTPEAAALIPDDLPDQAAEEATVVEYGMIHPLEEEAVVQAEFVCSSQFETTEGNQQRSDFTDDALAQPSPISPPLHQIRQSAGDELATEATVIASGPADKATEAAWSAADAMEAAVLQEGQRDTSFGSIDDLDTKPPALPVIRDCDIGVVAIEHDQVVAEALSPADGMQDDNLVPVDHISSGTVATVVDYDVHPSEMTSSVQAEFLGSSQVELGIEQVTEAAEDLRLGQAEHVLEVDATGTPVATEATVVDSGPAGKATAEAWSTGAAEAAQVLDETTRAVTTFSEHNEGEALSSSTTIAVESDHEGSGNSCDRHGVAEIVAISEVSHPSELILEDTAATAQLVGSDPNPVQATALAVEAHPTVTTSIDCIQDSTVETVILLENEQSMAVNSGSVSAPREAEATLISEVTDTETTRAVFAHQTSSASTIQESSQAVDGINGGGLEAVTAVAVLEVEDHAAANDDDFYEYPLKPSRDPIADRVQSEPTRSVSGAEANQNGGVQAVDAGPNTPPMAVATRVENSTGTTASAPPAIPVPDVATVERQSVDSDTRPPESSLPDHECGGGVHLLTNNLTRGTSNVMEMLFGNTRPGLIRKPISFEMDSLTASVLPRTLLPSSVIYSEATQSWVATVNTNQKALDCNDVEESSKALRAFSVPTKKQAICLARAWAPPRMHPFGSNPQCFICETQFAVFRRACHCRNCGVCVCSSCSMQWPSKMLPATYNIKKEMTVNTCVACDWLCSAFRLALLDGDYDKAIALFETGNINLTTPFANVKGELFYPVHCAVLGGNLNLLKWLVDEHCCPLRSIRVSSGKQKDSKSGSYTPILTSKGRSLLNIALSSKNIAISRYLVVEKRMLLWAERDLSVETLTQNLDLVLRVLPEEAIAGQQAYEQAQQSSAVSRSRANRQVSSNAATSNPSDMTSSSTLESMDQDMAAAIRASTQPDAEVGNVLHNDECIICCDNAIDCVLVPCGHQMCCLECGKNLPACPVCNKQGDFIRVFRA